jgi:hypothetical protein
MCKNRWNGSCRRKNKGFGSNSGRSCYLAELHDDSTELLSELVPRGSPHFSDEMEIVKTSREAARALMEESEGSAAGILASPSQDGGQGFDTDLVQIAVSLRSGMTSFSRHVTPSSATPDSRAAGRSNPRKSTSSGRRRAGRKKALPEMEEEMPELPLPHLDEANLYFAHESLLSPGSLLLQDYDEDDMAVIKAEEDVNEGVHSPAKRAFPVTFPDTNADSSHEGSVMPAPMPARSVSSPAPKSPFDLPRADAQCNGASRARHPAMKYVCPSKQLPMSLKAAARGAESPQKESLSPLLAPSRVPSCSVKWVSKEGSQSTAAKASVPGPYDAFTPVVTHPKNARFKKRGGKCSGHRGGGLPLRKSPIFVGHYIPKLAAKDGKRQSVAATTTAEERRNREPGLDEEETPEEGGELDEENQTPVAQLVSKSFRSHMIATPILNLSSPTFVHHNDNVSALNSAV